MSTFEEQKLEAIRRRKQEREARLQSAKNKQKVLIASVVLSTLAIGGIGYWFYTKPSPSSTPVAAPTARKKWTQPAPAPKKDKEPPKEKQEKTYTVVKKDLSPEQMKRIKELVLGEAYSQLNTIELKLRSPSVATVPEIAEKMKLRHKAIKEKIQFYENIKPEDSSTWPNDQVNQIP